MPDGRAHRSHPFQLADLLGIDAVPKHDVDDARTVPVGRSGFRIEFNPARPRGRLRHSIAHVIAHTLLPDCAEQVRHRLKRESLNVDEWQLEGLCNLAAAEIPDADRQFPGVEARRPQHCSPLGPPPSLRRVDGGIAHSRCSARKPSMCRVRSLAR